MINNLKNAHTWRYWLLFSKSLKGKTVQSNGCLLCSCYPSINCIKQNETFVTVHVPLSKCALTFA